MTLFSAVAGFAARGSQVFEKVEEDMSKLMEIKLRDNLTRGRARWEAHRAEKKVKRTLAKTLKSYGLNVDQIGVALEQGRGQEVVDYFRKFDGLYFYASCISNGCTMVRITNFRKSIRPKNCIN